MSRRRSAVPASQRGSQAWFTQAAADPSTLLAHDVDGSPGAPWQGQEEQASAAQRCWAKADRYYFASMARLQRLWEVRRVARCRACCAAAYVAGSLKRG